MKRRTIVTAACRVVMAGTVIVLGLPRCLCAGSSRQLGMGSGRTAAEEPASAARGKDAEGYRAEFIRLVKMPRELTKGV